ncbi:MAG: choice-of-anchor tandem repeat GloVer-containing protein, partial [Verrucomicrobiota bacterium]
MMKIKTLIALPALIASLGLLSAVRVTAQTFTILHSFTATSSSTNNDGSIPVGGLVLSGSTLYGATANGGNSGVGTVFSVNTDGSGFTALHQFTAFVSPLFANDDGAVPRAGLILSGGTLYGTAVSGGSSGNGTVFALKTNGTGFTTLHSFSAKLDYLTNSDGAYPRGLLLSGNTLYGTASYGLLCNPSRILFHRRAGAPFLRHRRSSTGKTQSPMLSPTHRSF